MNIYERTIVDEINSIHDDLTTNTQINYELLNRSTIYKYLLEKSIDEIYNKRISEIDELYNKQQEVFKKLHFVDFNFDCLDRLYTEHELSLISSLTGPLNDDDNVKYMTRKSWRSHIHWGLDGAKFVSFKDNRNLQTGYTDLGKNFGFKVDKTQITEEEFKKEITADDWELISRKQLSKFYESNIAMTHVGPGIHRPKGYGEYREQRSDALDSYIWDTEGYKKF